MKKGNNYKIKIADLDLYQSIKNKLKKTIKDKRNLNKECILHIKRLKIFNIVQSVLKQAVIAYQIKKPINLKEGGIVINTPKLIPVQKNDKISIEIDGKPLSEITLEKHNYKSPVFCGKMGKKLGIAGAKIRNKMCQDVRKEYKLIEKRKQSGEKQC